jgi:conjugal transfer pilus assembly protein TraI
MLSTLKNLFSRTPLPSSNFAVSPIQEARGDGLDVYIGDDDTGDFAITRYPPFDKGIPVVGVEKLLQSQQELVVRIFRTAGVSREDFEKYYQPSIRNLARHVHLLPATSTTYFRGTGGLFRMNLEIALNSLQSANAAVFPASGGVERRFSMQPKWNLATFLAGLCSQNYRTVNSMAVLTQDSAQWTPLLDHLLDWCEEQDAKVYFVRWMEDLQVHGAQASASYSISKIVSREVLQYLAADNNQVVQAMTAAIAGVETNASENPISRLVAPVITRVIEDDLKRSATNYGHLVIGAHLEPHLVDAMRRLVRGGKWIANNIPSGGRVWVGQEGVFIDWSSAAGDISNLLARDQFAGIPKDPDTLADLLVSANLLELNNRGGRYWTIALPGTLEAKDGMVKIKQGEVIFPQGFDLEPFKNVR